MGGRIDLDNPPEDCKPYADLYEREHKEKVSLEKQVRHVRDTWIAPTTHQHTLRQLYLMEQERNDFKARLEAMLSKPDPGHPDGGGKPWARAEGNEVLFGWLEDGTDEESYSIEEAESMASSLWRAARDARSNLRPDHVVRADPNHKPEARNLCICCDCNGHEVVDGACRICKKPEGECNA